MGKCMGKASSGCLKGIQKHGTKTLINVVKNKVGEELGIDGEAMGGVMNFASGGNEGEGGAISLVKTGIKAINQEENPEELLVEPGDLESQNQEQELEPEVQGQELFEGDSENQNKKKAKAEKTKKKSKWGKFGGKLGKLGKVAKGLSKVADLGDLTEGISNLADVGELGNAAGMIKGFGKAAINLSKDTQNQKNNLVQEINEGIDQDFETEPTSLIENQITKIQNAEVEVCQQ